MSTPPPAPAVRAPSQTRELLAVLMLSIGSLLPLLGWLVGVVLLWSSPWWNRREKLLGTLLPPGGYLAVLVLLGLPTQTCAEYTAPDGRTVSDGCTGYALPHTVGFVVAAALALLPLLTAALLWMRATTRARRHAQAAAGAA